MRGSALLETHKLSRNFGGLAAVNGVDLAVDEGEILGLIGPNGAGKSTLLNLIDGTLRVIERAASSSRGATSPVIRPTAGPGRASPGCFRRTPCSRA